MNAKLKAGSVGAIILLCGAGVLFSSVDMAPLGGSRATATVYRCPVGYALLFLSISVVLGIALARNALGKQRPRRASRGVTLLFALSVIMTLLGQHTVVVDGEGDHVVIEENVGLFAAREVSLPVENRGIPITEGSLFYEIGEGARKIRILRGIPPLTLSDTMMDYPLFFRKP